MADTLNIYGVTYSGVTGIKAYDNNNNVVTYLRSAPGGGLTEEVKQALLYIAANAAYENDNGDYYQTLYDALYPSKTLVSITAVYTQTGTVYPSTSLDALKTDLVVTAHYDDNSTATVTTYTLSGTLAVGTSTVTVSYDGKTTTFNVTVSEQATVVSISAVYTQSGTVYDTDSLDSLKADLVVTATWSDSQETTVASTDYTLSGTLTVGTSTITVTYEGKTTTFNVTVTHYSAGYVTDGLFAHWDAIDNQATGTHDANATSWVDKVNGHTWSAVTTDSTKAWSWDTDALVISPASTGNVYSNGKGVFTCPRPGTGLRTLEIVFTTINDLSCVGEFTSDLTGITDDTTQIIGVFSSDNTVTSKGVQNGYNATSITTIKSISATYGASYDATKVYKNAEELTSRGSSHSFRYHNYSGMVLGAQNSNANINDTKYPFKGVIHSIRMYSKELSAAEIAQNYAVDVERFNLA